jgi:hypothetical protein
MTYCCRRFDWKQVGVPLDAYALSVGQQMQEIMVIDSWRPDSDRAMGLWLAGYD